MYIWHPINKCHSVYKEARLYDPLFKEKINQQTPSHHWHIQFGIKYIRRGIITCKYIYMYMHTSRDEKYNKKKSTWDQINSRLNIIKQNISELEIIEISYLKEREQKEYIVYIWLWHKM